MKYENVTVGTFVSRPNRFIAHVMLDGEMAVCHVKNTGRCRELLVPGARVVLSAADNPARKTKYDLIAVWKGDMLINMDSQAPNIAFGEWARRTGFPDGLAELRTETKYGNSRFDFYYRIAGETAIGSPGDKECLYNSRNGEGFIEVKGVTLETGGVAAFPDAPTERGAKHVRELIKCRENGFGAYIAFVVQMPGMKYVTPNTATDPDFAAALRDAEAAGVQIIALECAVTPDSMEISGFLPVKLD